MSANASDTIVKLDPPQTPTKTTVSIPSNVMKALRIYMANEYYDSHDQSKVIVDALREYLKNRKIPIEDNGNGSGTLRRGGSTKHTVGQEQPSLPDQ